MANDHDNKDYLNSLRSRLAPNPQINPMGANHRISKRKITRIGFNPDDPMRVDEEKEDYALNERGHLEEVKEKTVYATTLEDGTPGNSHGFFICPTCGRLSSYANTIKCERCGMTCHVLLGCSTFSHVWGGWVCRHCYIDLGG